MQRIIMMVMSVDNGSIDSDDNSHNDDSVVTVEDIMMMQTTRVHVTGVKFTVCQSVVKAA